MTRVVQTVSIFVSLTVLSSSAGAGERRGLDDYSCKQLLADREDVSASSQDRLRTMEYWATGYAAAHQKDVPGANAAAVEVVASVLSQACREDPSQAAVQAIMNAVNKFISAERNSVTKVDDARQALIEQQISQRREPGETFARKKWEQQHEVRPQVEASVAEVAVLDRTFITYPNFDLYGGDSRKVESIGAQACVTTCEEDALCQAYSYDRWTKACYLKSSVAVLNLDPSSTTGIRNGLPPAPHSTSAVRINRLVSKAFTGTSRSIRAAGREACEQNCQQDRRCLGYTFSRNNSGCSVFDAIDTYQPNTSAISGLKTQNPP